MTRKSCRLSEAADAPAPQPVACAGGGCGGRRGPPVEYMDLSDYGVRGYTNLVLLQNKNYEAFLPIQRWLSKTLEA